MSIGASTWETGKERQREKGIHMVPIIMGEGWGNRSCPAQGKINTTEAIGKHVQYEWQDTAYPGDSWATKHFKGV